MEIFYLIFSLNFIDILCVPIHAKNFHTDVD